MTNLILSQRKIPSYSLTGTTSPAPAIGNRSYREAIHLGRYYSFIHFVFRLLLSLKWLHVIAPRAYIVLRQTMFKLCLPMPLAICLHKLVHHFINLKWRLWSIIFKLRIHYSCNIFDILFLLCLSTTPSSCILGIMIFHFKWETRGNGDEISWMAIAMCQKSTHPMRWTQFCQKKREIEALILNKIQFSILKFTSIVFARIVPLYGCFHGTDNSKTLNVREMELPYGENAFPFSSSTMVGSFLGLPRLKKTQRVVWKIVSLLLSPLSNPSVSSFPLLSPLLTFVSAIRKYVPLD